VPTYDFEQKDIPAFNWKKLVTFDKMECYRTTEEPQQYCVGLAAYYVRKYEKGTDPWIGLNISWFATIAKEK
jgi:hypothetical protein